MTTKIDWSNPRARVSKYFTVSEVTNLDDRRIPESGSKVEANILALATELDAVREAYGSPIGVTSWNRPWAVNREVGGASASQHLHGLAADIYPIGGDIYEFQNWLDARWGGALGYGAARGFVHVDLRGGGYMSGDGSIRWTY